MLESWEFGGKELERWEFERNSAVGNAAGGATARRGLGVEGRVLECWDLEGGSWNGGSLEENPPLVMQPEAQLHVVRWEWKEGVGVLGV